MELLGHTDCFHEDVWPQEVGGAWGSGGSAVLDQRLRGVVTGGF